jgi:hypothetical protein
MWLAQGVGGGRFGISVSTDELKAFELVSRDPTDRNKVSMVARAAAADLDGDGKDEIVVLASNPMPTLRGAQLTVSRVKGSGATASITTSESLNFPTVNGAYQRMQLDLADVDGDGKLDAIVMVYAPLRSTILVAWGTGTSFDTAGATVLTLPTEAGMPTGFAAVQLDADAARELAVATTTGVYAVDATGHTLGVARLGTLPAADSIALGDINADGIPDLALGGDHRVGIYLGGAKNP